MHYAIQFEDKQFDYLSLTSRKPTLKHQLIYVVEGLVSVRLGKLEYAIDKGNFFWLPANCLSALSYFPNTRCKVVEASQRLTKPFPNKAGYVKASELVVALFDRLANVPDPSEHQQVLLSAMQYELLELNPNLQTTSLSHKLNQWDSSSKDLSIEYQMVMRVKEAEKLRLSGTKEADIAQRLFAGSEQSYQAARLAVLGE
ncbi:MULTISPECIES: hypothetical protein [Vibrio]|uniref:hypothetical protein n=1 Tax=Vibrio TaxID=662 RepID=UPI00128E8C72|nr:MULTISPECIES: hypothetical protein [Vibrio]MPW36409.1 hypothetical protein [Vibrio sp. B1Z05]